MSTHFEDYKSVEGRFTACGRYYADGASPGRGVVITTKVTGVSCQTCIGSERFRLAKARIGTPLDAPPPDGGRTSAALSHPGPGEKVG